MGGTFKRSVLRAAAVCAVAAGAIPVGVAFADTSGTAAITEGTLAMVAPAAVTFAATLSGEDQVVTADQAIDVKDNTGAGSGWHLTLTTTTFTAGTKTLATDSVNEKTAPTNACDVSVTCTLASNTVTYPVAIPAAATAPPAVTIMNAATDTGMGGQTSTHTMSLAVPGNAGAGSYSSTWTYSLVSAP
jgi:hypothetical protein